MYMYVTRFTLMLSSPSDNNFVVKTQDIYFKYYVYVFETIYCHRSLYAV